MPNLVVNAFFILSRVKLKRKASPISATAKIGQEKVVNRRLKNAWEEWLPMYAESGTIQHIVAATIVRLTKCCPNNHHRIG